MFWSLLQLPPYDNKKYFGTGTACSITLFFKSFLCSWRPYWRKQGLQYKKWTDGSSVTNNLFIYRCEKSKISPLKFQRSLHRCLLLKDNKIFPNMKISRKHILLVYGESPQRVWCCGDTMSLLRGNVATDRPTRNDTSTTLHNSMKFQYNSRCLKPTLATGKKKEKKGNADFVTLFQH